jgi:hypothetical protein
LRLFQKLRLFQNRGCFTNDCTGTEVVRKTAAILTSRLFQ